MQLSSWEIEPPSFKKERLNELKLFRVQKRKLSRILIIVIYSH